MKKLFPVCVAVSLIGIVLWQVFAQNTNYYLVSVIVLIISMLPFFSSFERSAHTAREITLIASLVALAVVSRAVFYLVPQVKPIAAVVAVSGVCLGGKRGYIVGAMSMFVSNFIFGQGVWTPFQMVAMGCVGLAFGLIFKKIRINKISLAVAGFFCVLIIYGLIVDLSSVLMFSTQINASSMIAVYAAGAPFNIIFAVTTAVFLFFFGEAFIKKIERLNTKYGICVSEVGL